MSRFSNFNFENTKFLVEVNIGLYRFKNEDYVEEDSVNQSNEFLEKISMVKYLSLDSWSIYQVSFRN